MKKIFIPVLIAGIAASLIAGCSPWVQPENKDYPHEPLSLSDQSYSEYCDALAAWKAGTHYYSYVRFDNNSSSFRGEGNFLRSLPDSLDMVVLMNTELSASDREDITLLHSKGTRALLRLDFAAQMSALSDEASLGSALDALVAAVKENGLDGWSFTGEPLYTDPWRAQAATLIMQKFVAAKGQGMLIVMEGDPLFVQAADRDKVDLFVLGTEKMKKMSDVRSLVTRATGYGAIPVKKLLLASPLAGSIYDENNNSAGILETLTARVRPLGPLAGLAMYGIEDDYYSPDGNYLTIRSTINELNK